MRIRGKILSGLTAVTILTIVMGGYAAVSLQHSSSLTEKLYDGPLMASDFAGSAMINFVKLVLVAIVTTPIRPACAIMLASGS